MNKITLIGFSGQDAETKTLENSSVSTFSVATTEKYNNKQGEKVSTTTWHNCVAWNKEKVCSFIKKGTQIAIVGSIKHEEYADKDGIKKQSTKVIVNEIELLGSKTTTNEAPY